MPGVMSLMNSSLLEDYIHDEYLQQNQPYTESLSGIVEVLRECNKGNYEHIAIKVMPYVDDFMDGVEYILKQNKCYAFILSK